MMAKCSMMPLMPLRSVAVAKRLALMGWAILPALSTAASALVITRWGMIRLRGS